MISKIKESSSILMHDEYKCKKKKKKTIILVFIQGQTILQHFYKRLMWQIFISSNMSPLLTSFFFIINIWKILKSHQQFVKML